MKSLKIWTKYILKSITLIIMCICIYNCYDKTEIPLIDESTTTKIEDKNEEIKINPEDLDVVRDKKRTEKDFTFQLVRNIDLKLQISEITSVNTRPEVDIKMKQKANAGLTRTIISITSVDSEQILYQGITDDGDLLEDIATILESEDNIKIKIEKIGYYTREITVNNLQSLDSIEREIFVAENPNWDPDSFVDTDGDLIPDNLDVFPEDGSKAFLLFFPPDQNFTVAFEDNYPALGDADYNDFVARYKLSFVKNNDNKVIQIDGNSEAVLKLAGFDHDFHLLVEHPGEASCSVTYKNFIEDVLSTTSFDSTNKTSVPLFIHTKNALTEEDKDGTKIYHGNYTEFTISFAEPVDASELSLPPYDPYIYVHNTGKDIHLPGKNKIEGSKNPAINENFIDKNGYPWALLVPADWAPPLEKIHINDAYPDYHKWVECGGMNHFNWYLHPDWDKVYFQLINQMFDDDYIVKFIKASEGGVIELPGEIVVTIPPNALSADAYIKITILPEEPYKEAAKYHDGFTLKPSSSIFDIDLIGDEVEILSPIQLKFKYHGPIPSRCVRYDEENEKYTEYDVVDYGDNRTITVDVDHFTVYASGNLTYTINGTQYNDLVTNNSLTTSLALKSVINHNFTSSTHIQNCLTLPINTSIYSNRNIGLTQTWLYTHEVDGKFAHYALDWEDSIDLTRTYLIRAASRGEVLFAGWDMSAIDIPWWHGNTVVISHASDTVRTLYMHLRNGRTNDVSRTRNIINNKFLSNTTNVLQEKKYEYLANNYQNSEIFFGTDEQRMLVSAGDTVVRGQAIAYCGNTGPGGINVRRGDSINAFKLELENNKTNIHLHFMMAVEESGHWYFVDPYGIYNDVLKSKESSIFDNDSDYFNYIKPDILSYAFTTKPPTYPYNDFDDEVIKREEVRSILPDNQFDIINPADVDGDGKAELIGYSNNNGNITIKIIPLKDQNLDIPNINTINFNIVNDLRNAGIKWQSYSVQLPDDFDDYIELMPMTGDFNNDGKADLVFRHPSGFWIIYKSISRFVPGNHTQLYTDFELLTQFPYQRYIENICMKWDHFGCSHYMSIEHKYFDYSLRWCPSHQYHFVGCGKFNEDNNDDIITATDEGLYMLIYSEGNQYDYKVKACFGKNNSPPYDYITWVGENTYGGGWKYMQPSKINYDDYLDLIAFRKNNSKWTYNLHDGNFKNLLPGYGELNFNFTDSSQFEMLEPADMRGDGDADFVFINEVQGSIIQYENRSSNGFHYWKDWHVGWALPSEGWRILAPSDVNGDNVADLIAYHPDGHWRVAINRQNEN